MMSAEMLDSTQNKDDRNTETSTTTTTHSDATNLNRSPSYMMESNDNDSINLIKMNIHKRKMDDNNTIDNDNNDSIIDLENSPSDDFKYDDDDNKELINHNNPSSSDYNEDRDLSKEFFFFKTHVKNKRKATFCCIFSIGSLILSIVLLLAPLSTKMNTQYQRYHQSTEYQCIISNKTYLNGTQYKYHIDDDNNNIDDTQCIFIYSRTDRNTFTDKCSTMHEEENQLCNISRNDQRYDINHTDSCYFYNNGLCEGTMINSLMLERNNNMFIPLLSIGTLFAVITICSGIYGIRLIQSTGIYCSVMSIQQDDDKIFGLMKKYQEEEKHKKGVMLRVNGGDKRNKGDIDMSSLQHIHGGSSHIIGSIASSSFTELSSDITSTHE